MNEGNWEGVLRSWTVKLKDLPPFHENSLVIYTLTHLKTASCVGVYDTFFNVRLKIHFQYTNTVCLPED